MSIKTRKLRDRENYANNASKKHKEVGTILSQGIFERMTVFQEYPVDRINSQCPNGRLKVDWYIKTLNIAIEVQGEHHFHPVQYGGQSKDKATNSFVKQIHKDIDKARYCNEAGCPVIEVHYKDKLSTEWLLARIKNASEQITQEVTIAPQTTPKEKSQWEKDTARHRREYNRKQYRQLRAKRRDRRRDSD